MLDDGNLIQHICECVFCLNVYKEQHKCMSMCVNIDRIGRLMSQTNTKVVNYAIVAGHICLVCNATRNVWFACNCKALCYHNNNTVHIAIT